MGILMQGDRVGVLAASNAVLPERKTETDALFEALTDMGLNPVLGDFVYGDIFSGSPEDKADVLNDFYRDSSIKAIFDISGGDLSNSLLPYLDYRIIKKRKTPFFGYSDLTTLINGIYAKTGNAAFLYQVANIVRDGSGVQKIRFKESILGRDNSLFDLNDCRYLQGTSMNGEVIGGNIRCFLKLAGTEYMPDFNRKILFLEANSGDEARIFSYLNQLKQLGVFEKIKGVLLGNFTEMEDNNKNIGRLLLQVMDNKKIPVAKTDQVGHGLLSRCIVIGREYVMLRQ
ncbi:Muramoyltetrapeptide carboxypeptidase LdcA (peptidoglycan recycling) [Acetitomaculum ruminis DSM 5522]|uniref:Muramoyltetrapeptide carboxypeptidase LdcA (Peptidoglycan recycling) n=2 Tax=Acetitomaculum ruminis TaxID=2382 RepID=A0A1I0YAB9_9FIRM|nr:Muramoyltetrapeptide carboxypeptidase LdcA (peptidoglycan recycling) [Acetitomaculum ruminis DSM 5522]